MEKPELFQVVSFNEWWEGDENQQRRRLPLIDVRSSDEYENCRIKNDETAVVVHLPLDDLLSGQRSSELPPRHVEFSILMSEKESSSLELVNQFFGATQSRATQQSRQPWLVRQIIIDTPGLWEEASRYSIVQRGKPTCGSNDSYTPLPRLWEPDSMIETILLPLLKQVAVAVDSSEKQDVWDLGSGAGRDVCFLAEEFKSFQSPCPLNFVGIDNHKASGERCRPFWTRRGVDDITDSRLLNLKKQDQVEAELEKRSIVCLYAVRFWNRKLVQLLSNTASLRPGTLFAISHFCKPHLGAKWEFDHPKEHHVLERNELHDIFDHGGEWQILHDELSSDGDHGRTLIQFVARRCR